MTDFIKNNPLVIHVAAEVVVLGGLSFYFQKRMLKLEASVKNVIENVEKMHNVLYQHEKHINDLINGIQHRNTEEKKIIKIQEDVKPIQKKSKKKNQKKQTVLKKLNKVVNKSESEGEESFSDDDLDEELSTELNELKENNLKRENENENNNNDDDDE